MSVFYLVLIVLLLLYFWMQRRKYWLAWKIRGPLGLPFLGGLHLLRPENILVELTKCYDIYNSPCTFWIGPMCVLVISDPVNMERILTSPICVDRSVFHKIMKKFIGDGLLSNNNPKWNAHRKLIRPMFKTNNLLQFISIFNVEIKKVCEKLEKCVGLKQPVNIEDIFLEYTFNTSFETITGHKNTLPYENSNHIIKSYKTMMDAFLRLNLNPLYYFHIIIKIIDRPFYDQIKKALHNSKKFMDDCIEMNSRRIKELKTTLPNIAKYNFISHALELNRKGLFTISEVIGESNHLLIAAFETTAQAAFYIITLLAIHPEWQKLLYEEIEEKFPNKETELSFESIKDTPLIDIVIKESLRLLPVGPVVARKSSADFILFDDVVVPKDTEIVLNIYSMHRSVKYWGADALDFNPHRFLRDEIKEKHPYLFVPFLKGPRNCIGQQYAYLSLRVLLINVIRRFRLITTFKLSDIELILSVTSKMAQKPLFTIENR